MKRSATALFLVAAFVAFASHTLAWAEASGERPDPRVVRIASVASASPCVQVPVSSILSSDASRLSVTVAQVECAVQVGIVVPDGWSVSINPATPEVGTIDPRTMSWAGCGAMQNAPSGAFVAPVILAPVGGSMTRDYGVSWRRCGGSSVGSFDNGVGRGG